MRFTTGRDATADAASCLRGRNRGKECNPLRWGRSGQMELDDDTGGATRPWFGVGTQHRFGVAAQSGVRIDARTSSIPHLHELLAIASY